MGLLYPATWFDLWHFAPQAVLTSEFPGAPYSFVLYAILLGLSYGYYSWVTGSIRWGTVSHIVQDSLGLAGGTFLAGMGLLL
ncbi:CAAX protease self-immunity [Halogranum amylolyticum]|uniref:CAAX protease self-immunity n=1 Tax=Halogranum amylolyticum TaxID=660520 RepID=A0A1H8UL59_9EURY|nr:CPBP family glutamic-type intramembrane protease [Halogranum amylolyticum]SEP03747.1 CAAX protease self-immunity [Halogranum amylolyticum]